jgi:FAD binding domain
MNMGIQDAFNLAWKLSHVIRNAASPQLLDSYEAERKPIDETVIRQTDRATRLVSPHGSVTRFVRDHDVLGHPFPWIRGEIRCGYLWDCNQLSEEPDHRRTLYRAARPYRG